MDCEDGDGASIVNVLNIELRKSRKHLVRIRNSFRYIVFRREIEPTPSHNNQLILPSGIAVIGIDLWAVRFTKLFNKLYRESEESSSHNFVGRNLLPSS
jgi:hypothetical protein